MDCEDTAPTTGFDISLPSASCSTDTLATLLAANPAPPTLAAASYAHPIPRGASVLEHVAALKQEQKSTKDDTPPHLRQDVDYPLPSKSKIQNLLSGIDESRFPETTKHRKREKLHGKSVRKRVAEHVKRHAATYHRAVDVTTALLLAVCITLFAVCYLAGRDTRTLPQMGIIDFTPGQGDLKGSLQSYRTIFGLGSVRLNAFGYCIAAGRDYAGCFADPPNLGEVPEILPPETARSYDTFVQEFAPPIAQWTARAGVVRAILAAGMGMGCVGLLFAVFVAARFPLVGKTADYYVVVASCFVDVLAAAVVLAVCGITREKAFAALGVRQFDLQVRLGGVYYVAAGACAVSLLAAAGVACSFLVSRRKWRRAKEYL